MNFLTAEHLSRATGTPVNDNMRSLIAALDAFGADVGLDRPHRLAHYGAQWIHESGNFRYDREVWGPTPAQKRYEGRADLGNTHPGDGEKFKGHTAAQITGRANTAEFMEWCRKQGYNPPDFVTDPSLMNTDPWEGLGPLWFWTTRKLNPLADANNIEMITRKINGGLNGFAERMTAYRKIGLVLLGFGPDQLEQFQVQAKKDGLYDGEIDGEDGPKSRAAIHMALVKLDGLRSVKSEQVKASPVTEEVKTEVPVAVVPPAATKGRVRNWLFGVGGFITANAGSFFTTDIPTKLLIVGISGVAIAAVLWKGDVIARQVKRIAAEIEG